MAPKRIKLPELYSRDDALVFPPLLALCPDTLAKIVSLLARNQSHLLNLRLAHRVLMGTAAAMVTALVAEDGHLPPKAFLVFASAFQLHVKVTAPTLNIALLNILELLTHAPDTITQLHITQQGRSSFDADETNAALTKDASLPLCEAISASKLAHGLKKLYIQPEITTNAADALLGGLPQLVDLSLRISDTPTPFLWSPGFISTLKSVSLCASIADPPNLSLDAAAFTACSGLSQLQLDSYKISNAAAIDSLTSLQLLQLSRADDAPSWSPSTALQRLHRLVAPYLEVSTDDWALLSQLPKLSDIKLFVLNISSVASPAAVTSLTVEGQLILDAIPRDEYLRCLTRLLPQLHELLVLDSYDEISMLAKALFAHTSLTSLHASGAQEDDDWEDCQFFNSIQQLKQLDLRAIFCKNTSYLFQDIAGCPALEELSLEFGGSPVTYRHRLDANGFNKLANGNCSNSLKRVCIETWEGLDAGLSDVQQLLRDVRRKRLPLLETLELHVAVADDVEGGLMDVWGVIDCNWLLEQVAAKVRQVVGEEDVADAEMRGGSWDSSGDGSDSGDDDDDGAAAKQAYLQRLVRAVTLRQQIHQQLPQLVEHSCSECSQERGGVGSSQPGVVDLRWGCCAVKLLLWP